MELSLRLIDFCNIYSDEDFLFVILLSLIFLKGGWGCYWKFF